MVRRRDLTLVWALGALSIVATAFAQKPTEAQLPPILQKAISAAGSIRYSGERVVEFREGPDRVLNREFVWKDGENLRIEYPTGSRSAGQIIVERGRKRWHYYPDKNEVHLSPSRRDEVVQRLVGSFRFGGGRGLPKFEVVDGGVVAGVHTNRVLFKGPRGEVVQSLWINERSGLILKRELFNPVGGREGYYEFTRINLSPNFRSKDFEVRVPGARIVLPAELALRMMKEGGFAKVFLEESNDIELEGARSFGNGKGLALHYRVKKGVLSLIQVKTAIEAKMLERMRRDGQNVVTWKKADKTFVLIGSMSESELRALSQRTQER